MTDTLLRISTPLLAAAILLCGHGLQLTLLPARAELLGWSLTTIGLTGSFYFLGFVLGCLVIPGIVATVAHIRTFHVMAAIATLAVLLAGLIESTAAWLILRFGTGFAFAGLYMVIESWLSHVAPEQSRGAVLAAYTTICLTSMMAGQWFLMLYDAAGHELFMIAAALLCLAILPVGLTRLPPPPPLPGTRFSPKVLLRASRVALVCAFLGALVTGAIWTMGPLVAAAFDLTSAEVGGMMSTILLGGIVSQFPVGYLSDRMDRRMVIAGLLVFGAIAALVGWLLAHDSRIVLYATMFCIGASSLPIYSQCIATASDNSSIPLIEIASGILVMNSLGSILSPITLAPMLNTFGPSSFFLFVLACLSLAATWTIFRIVVVERPKTHDHAPVLPRTTPVVAGLYPASDEGKQS
jgi:MFS family permease